MPSHTSHQKMEWSVEQSVCLQIFSLCSIRDSSMLNQFIFSLAVVLGSNTEFEIQIWMWLYNISVDMQTLPMLTIKTDLWIKSRNMQPEPRHIYRVVRQWRKDRNPAHWVSGKIIAIFSFVQRWLPKTCRKLSVCWSSTVHHWRTTIVAIPGMEFQDRGYKVR